MKRFTLYLLALFALPFCFLQATCETPLQKTDRVTNVADSVINEYRARIDSALDQTRQCIEVSERLQTHLTLQLEEEKTLRLQIQRQIDSMTDLNAEFEAERDQKEKYRQRLDSAVRIIERQNIQLANSVYNKPK